MKKKKKKDRVFKRISISSLLKHWLTCTMLSQFRWRGLRWSTFFFFFFHVIMLMFVWKQHGGHWSELCTCWGDCVPSVPSLQGTTFASLQMKSLYVLENQSFFFFFFLVQTFTCSGQGGKICNMSFQHYKSFLLRNKHFRPSAKSFLFW